MNSQIEIEVFREDATTNVVSGIVLDLVIFFGILVVWMDRGYRFAGFTNQQLGYVFLMLIAWDQSIFWR